MSFDSLLELENYHLTLPQLDWIFYIHALDWYSLACILLSFAIIHVHGGIRISVQRSDGGLSRCTVKSHRRIRHLREQVHVKRPFCKQLNNNYSLCFSLYFCPLIYCLCFTLVLSLIYHKFLRPFLQCLTIKNFCLCADWKRDLKARVCRIWRHLALHIATNWVPLHSSLSKTAVTWAAECKIIPYVTVITLL